MNFSEFLQADIATGITVNDMIWFFAIIILSIIIGKSVTLSMKRWLEDKIPKESLRLILKGTYYAIILVGIVIGLPSVNLSGLLVAGGIFGVVIGFAGQSVFSNILSGIFLLIERPMKIGDNVKIGDVYGVVEDVKIISTIVRTFDGTLVRIPNENIFTGNIINYDTYVARRFEYAICIGLDDDVDRAIVVLKNIIQKHPLALKNPEPSVYMDEIGSDGIIIRIRIWAPSKDWWNVKTETLWEIKQALDEEGFEFPYPQRTILFPDVLRTAEISQNE